MFCLAVKTSSALLLELLNETLNTERRSQTSIMLQKQMKLYAIFFNRIISLTELWCMLALVWLQNSVR